MKKLLVFLILTMISSLSIFASGLQLKNVVPESGSELSSFDIELVFDLSGFEKELEGKEYGIGCYGSYLGIPGLEFMDVVSTLYEGEGDDKTAIAQALTENVDGTSSTFSVGNSFIVSFSGIVPNPGKKYTVEIGNSFQVYLKGDVRMVPNSELDFQASPLTLVYTGGGSNDNVVTLEDCSILNGSKKESITEITYTFNTPVVLTSTAGISILENDVVLYTSDNVSVENNRVTFSFPENLLLNGHEYVITLPEGFITSQGNPAIKNKKFSVGVKGAGFNSFGIKSSTPENNSTELFEKIQIIFNLPEGYSLKANMGEFSNYAASIYKDNVSDESKLWAIDGTVSNGNTITWSFKTLAPSTTYILSIPKHQFSAWKGMSVEDYANEEILFKITTPSIENSGIPPLAFDVPVVGKHDVGSKLKEDQEYSNIEYLDISLKDMEYVYNGTRYVNMTLVPDVINSHSNKGSLYEITDDGEVFIKEFPVSVREIMGMYDSYDVLEAALRSTLYEGKKYRIVIPAGIVTIPVPSLYNFVLNPELSYVVLGSTPSEAKVTSCSVEENAEMSELYNVVWGFKGDFSLVADAKAKAKLGNVTNYYPIYVRTESGITYLTVNLTNYKNGNPMKLSDGVDATITLPAGILTYPTDETVTNKEVVLNVKGKTPAPAVTEPEFVTVTVLVKESEIVSADDVETIPNVYSYSLDAVKGKKFKLNLADGMWKVGSLYRDGNDALGMVGDDGIYTTPALKENTVIAASLDLKEGPFVTIDQTVGIKDIPNTTYRVYCDGDHIVIEGLSGGENINVYNMAGIVLANTIVSSEMNTVKISVQTGQYVVMINNTPVKIIIR